MGTSDSKNEMDWLGKVWRTDPKKCEGPVRKMKKIELDWFEKWERLTGKMGKSDSKKWESVNRKMRSTDSKHGGSESISRQVWLEEKRSCWHLTAIVYRIAFFCKLNWITTSMEIIKLPY